MEQSKFQQENWQRHDIIRLLMKHDELAKVVTKERGEPKDGIGFNDPHTGKKLHSAGTANWSEMGCLAGDTRIVVNRGSSVRYWSLEEAYLGFNRLNDDKRKNWKSDETYRTHSFVDGRIRHHEIESIQFTGVKSTLKITFADGRTVRLTHDHLLLKPDGDWVEAQSVSEGDYLIVRGGKGKKHNADTRRYLDENKQHNDPANLQTMTLAQHSQLHARNQIASYDAPPMQVVRIEEAGETDVYDISMAAPFHNFVANGVVVHNCYKTSTGLWFIDRKIREANLTDHAPSILIITNKSGKGTFFEAVPEIYKDWTFINIETSHLEVNIGGNWLKLPPSKQKFVPKQFGMPTICLAHYNIFSFSNKGQFEEDEEGRPIRDENGKFVLKPWRQADYIIDHLWDFVWCDEFHRMKDKDSRWTVGIKKIKTTVGRHGSTGTGFINRPNEIWSLLNWLDPVHYNSYWDFHEEYCEIDDWDGYSKVTGVKPENKDEFRKLVRKIGVRRTLDQTHPDIEKAVFTSLNVELNSTQRKMYNEIKSELATMDANGVELYSANVLSLLQRLRQICVGTPEVVADYYDADLDRRVQKIRLTEPSSKLDAVMELLEGLQWDEEKKEPLVVFSCFKDPLELLKVRLEKHNDFILSNGLDESMMYPYIHMDVSDSDETRYRKWHDEFPTMKYRIFMSTLQLGGESINLTPAHHLVFLDRSWSPKDNNQGIGRIRRPGQTSVPNIININALRTTDQYIEKVNDIKHGWFREIFSEDR